MPPLVSVVIPVYNNGRFAEEAIESALAQTYQPLEVVVVDDGSLEPMAWLTRRFAGRIAYYAKPNGGPASARNLGIRHSRGTYVAFLDADDVWEPRKLAAQVAALERHPAAGLVYAAVATMDRDGRLLNGAGPVEPRPSGRIFTALFMQNVIPTSTVLVRRAYLDEVGLFDEAPELISAEDYDLWLRLAERYEVAYVPEQLVRYRVHPAGISRDPVRSYGSEQRVVEHALGRHPEIAPMMPERLRRLFFEFGCELFSQHDLRGARPQFLRSLRYRPLAVRAWGYMLATCLTPSGVAGLRRLKRVDLYRVCYQRILLPAYERLIKRRRRLAYRALLARSQRWPTEQLRAFQRQELHKLLRHASEQVPYWQSVFRQLGLRPDDLADNEEAFRRLPLMTKETIRAHRVSMVARNWRGRTWAKATGGSTGEPLVFEYTPVSDDWRVAASQRGYGWAGCEEGAKQAYIWGAAIGPVPWPKRIKEALHHAIIRQRYFNCFEFDEERMAACLAALNRYRPEILVGYTNPLYEFAKFVTRRGGAAFRPHAIITGAEKLHEFQRETIREAFGCPVFNTYGSREFMLIASECEHHGLHVAAENLLVEVLRDDGRPAAPGEIGRVVITDLHNYGMPFIRYEIGDLAVLAEEPCRCGRSLPLLADVVGRSLDLIRTPDGRLVPGEFFPHLMKEFRWVKRFQVVQDRVDRLTVKIVRNGGFDAGQRAFMERQIRRAVGSQMRVDVAFVEDIPLTRAGKLRVTVSHVANNRGGKNGDGSIFPATQAQGKIEPSPFFGPRTE